MVHSRDGAGCSIFKSSLHGGHPVIIAVGGFGSRSDTSEVWDFTNEGTTWQLSKFKFAPLI